MVTNKLLTHGRFCVHPSHGEGSGVCGSILSRALEGGDKVLLALLDQRFPDKDKTDELGEMSLKCFHSRFRQMRLSKAGLAVHQSCSTA